MGSQPAAAHGRYQVSAAADSPWLRCISTPHSVYDSLTARSVDNMTRQAGCGTCMLQRLRFEVTPAAEVWVRVTLHLILYRPYISMFPLAPTTKLLAHPNLADPTLPTLLHKRACDFAREHRACRCDAGSTPLLASHPMWRRRSRWLVQPCWAPWHTSRCRPRCHCWHPGTLGLWPPLESPSRTPVWTPQYRPRSQPRSNARSGPPSCCSRPAHDIPARDRPSSPIRLTVTGWVAEHPRGCTSRGPLVWVASPRVLQDAWAGAAASMRLDARLVEVRCCSVQ